MKYIESLYLSSIPLDKQEMEEVYQKKMVIINELVDVTLEFIESNLKNNKKNVSEFLKLKKRTGSFYVRFGNGIYGKFGHPYFCLSSISLNDKLIGKKVFSVYLMILVELLKERRIILSIENPITKRFQCFLKEMGFVFPMEGKRETGVFYYLLPEESLISHDELYNLSKS